MRRRLLSSGGGSVTNTSDNKAVTLSKGVYLFEAWGAKGKDKNSYTGGYGGYSAVLISVLSNTQFTMKKNSIVYSSSNIVLANNGGDAASNTQELKREWLNMSYPAGTVVPAGQSQYILATKSWTTSQVSGADTVMAWLVYGGEHLSDDHVPLVSSPHACDRVITDDPRVYLVDPSNGGNLVKLNIYIDTSQNTEPYTTKGGTSRVTSDNIYSSDAANWVRWLKTTYSNGEDAATGTAFSGSKAKYVTKKRIALQNGTTAQSTTAMTKITSLTGVISVDGVIIK